MASNEFAEKARARKVRSMVVFFDVELPRAHNIHPLSAPSAAADWLRKLTDAEWRHYAVIAGQRPPSAETITEIIAVYERRAFELTVGNVKRLDWAN